MNPTHSVMPSDDLYLPLAFSMHSTPGAYAVLVGAGVSMGAGLPTAWDIVVDLARKLCYQVNPDRAEGLTADNVEEWYVATYNVPLSYSGLLEQVAPTVHEREAVLRQYFEPQSDVSGTDTTTRRFLPSVAHESIADMMAAGVIRVVVTMNFDHLLEDALSARGIDPVIVRTDNDAAGLAPLHTIQHLVVHLHGDYRDPASMLNTGTELSGYELHMQHLLAQIVSSHGLIVAGWSAVHDHALRGILRRAHRRYYTAGWINPTDLGPAAHELATRLGARLLHDTADEAFARLADAVATMRRNNARHPLSPLVVIDRIKRDLTNQRPAITAHDSLTDELARLDEAPALLINDYNDRVTLDNYAALVEQVDEACLVPEAAIATLAYWGSGTTDLWWLPSVEQWSRSIDRSGFSALLDAPLLVGVRLFYAAGISAVAAKRYDLLTELLGLPATASATLRQPSPACQILDWNAVHQGCPDELRKAARARLAEAIAGALALSTVRLDAVWQEFETLRTAGQILARVGDQHIDRLAAAEEQWEPLRDGEATEERRATYIELDKARAEIARLATSVNPHVHVSDHRIGSEGDRWVNVTGQRLGGNPDQFVEMRSLATGVRESSRSSAVAAAINGALTYFHLCAAQLADTYVGVGVATFMPQELWLDESKPASVRL